MRTETVRVFWCVGGLLLIAGFITPFLSIHVIWQYSGYGVFMSIFDIPADERAPLLYLRPLLAIAPCIMGLFMLVNGLFNNTLLHIVTMIGGAVFLVVTALFCLPLFLFAVPMATTIGPGFYLCIAGVLFLLYVLYQHIRPHIAAME